VKSQFGNEGSFQKERIRYGSTNLLGLFSVVMTVPFHLTVVLIPIKETDNMCNHGQLVGCGERQRDYENYIYHHILNKISPYIEQITP